MNEEVMTESTAVESTNRRQFGVDCIVTEGKANIIRLPFVFYNKVQEFNRDLSVLAINTFLKNQLWKNNLKPNKWIKDQITILDALSATGLRSIRYALECTDCCELPIKIYANDVSIKAIETIDKNIERNNVKDRVVSNREDAAIFMIKNRDFKRRFSIIDLDPYGSPAIFLDSAVQSLAEGGLLMVTCTDMAVLCGNHSETCHAKYGSISLRSKSCHEMALRIILRSIESHANRYGRYIVPLISLSVDFYVRIFLQIYTSPNEVKRSASKLSYVYHCTGCESIELQRLTHQKNIDKEYNFIPNGPKVDRKCQHCGHTYQMGGPIWSDPIHSIDFVRQLQKQLSEFTDQTFSTHKRLHGILQVINEELIDCPLYYCLDRLCRVVQCSMPSMRIFRSAILNGGYQVSYSHANKTSIKTNATNDYIWDVMREIYKQNPNDNLNDKSAGFAIIKQQSSHTISLEPHDSAEPMSKEMQLLRYQVNPEPNWGPQSLPSKQCDKRVLNQGKRSRPKDNDDNKDE
ncbi:tRNA (guanine(26)-N(2))-dimethyltransferase-like, partial [Oppia nitens]|uniref:tRNA (guanine(26)-N(2))-dimethyltransferase-like n=1 Tax=Oppia nitens TaxID=1686743 RepID=UPI0023DC6551